MSGSEVVVITSPSSSDPEPPTIDAPAATEALAEASTEVAQIAADRDVAIAEIQAEVASEAIEAASESTAAETEIQQCRQSIETLGNQVASLAETVLLIQTKLAEAPPNLQSEGEVDPEKTEAQPSPEQQRKKKALRWI